MEYAISARGLAKSFRNREVIRDCTLEIKRGEVYGFLGENGTGETAVFRLLLGLLKPSAGEAAILAYGRAAEEVDSREIGKNFPGALCTRDLFHRVETMEV